MAPSVGNPVYLDHHASAPLCAAARTAAQAWLAEAGAGNPSSVHGSGQAARHALERARRQVAEALGAHPREVVFTSGATEANHLAIRGASAALPPGLALRSAAEHDSVVRAMAALEGWTVAVVPLTEDGRLGPLPEGPVALASVMAVSNELGTVMPVAALAEQLRARDLPGGGRCVVHCDATQALGRVPLSLDAADLWSLSGHKIGALPGIGALLVREGAPLRPLVPGHQESERRGGTENLLGAITLGAACGALAERLAAAGRVRALRDRLAAAVAALPGPIPVHRHAATLADEEETGSCLSLAFPGLDAADLVRALDLEGVAISAGSACSSGTLSPSPVIAALVAGRADADSLARGTIRLSLGPESSEADVDTAAEALGLVACRLAAL